MRISIGRVSSGIFSNRPSNSDTQIKKAPVSKLLAGADTAERRYYEW
jgi:hypothetical protein